MHIVTVKEAAQWFGIDVRTMRKKLESGEVEKEPCGGIDIQKWVPSQMKKLREQAAGRISDKGDYDLVSERARLAKAQADKTEMEVDVMKKTLLIASDTLREWQNLLSACRAKLLSVPSKCALQIASLKEPKEVERYLKRAIHDALAELARYEPDIAADVETSSDSARATSGDDDKPVGRQKPKAKPRSKQRARKVANG